VGNVILMSYTKIIESINPEVIFEEEVNDEKIPNIL
jgi:hypothetical protein